MLELGHHIMTCFPSEAGRHFFLVTNMTMVQTEIIGTDEDHNSITIWFNNGYAVLYRGGAAHIFGPEQKDDWHKEGF